MTQTKPVETRHRLTWAAHYPLLPGRDIMSRRGLLVLIAECSLSGSYYESQERLAERAGITSRGVRKLLVKLCAEGALSARSRGFKKTTRYTLQRLDEVAEHGGFLPPGEANAGPFETNHSSPQATLERNHSSGQTMKPPAFERNHSSGQTAFERNHSSYKAVKAYALKPPLTPPSKPKPENEPGTISPTARRLNEYLSRKTGRTLPASWQSYQHLTKQVDRLNFPRLASVLAATIESMSGFLPEPEDFFASYDEKAVSTRKRDRKKDRKQRRKAA